MERRARHALEVARAYSSWNRTDDAQATLLDAEQMALEQVRYHFISRQLSRASQPNAEIAGWEFVAADGLTQYLPDRLGRRVHVALSARQDGAPAYAEHGLRVS